MCVCVVCRDYIYIKHIKDFNFRERERETYIEYGLLILRREIFKKKNINILKPIYYLTQCHTICVNNVTKNIFYTKHTTHVFY